MGTVFISYARRDIAFVRRLHGALEGHGRNAWVDWEGIPPSDKWLAKIRSAIEEADAFLFVISPDAIASEVCGIELEYAIKQHKRLIPVVYREAEASTIRRELSELNYIFARDADSFDTACERLVTALDTDLEWIQVHTRLLVRAVEWDREDREASYTLRGRDLDDFEEWLTKSPDKEPKPTALQSQYLLASRRTVTRRQRIVGGLVAVGLSIAIGLGTIAYFQNRERQRQETIAEARQLVNRSQALRDGPADAVGARGRMEESTRSATQALATFHELGIPSLAADQAVRKSYAALPKWVDVDLGHDRIDASSFDATGAYLAVFQGREHLMVWDTTQRQETGSCRQPLTAMESAVAVAIGGDGTLSATAVYNAGKGVTDITIWSMPDCRRRQRVQLPGRRDRIALGGNGEYLIVHEGSTIRLWEVALRSERSFDFADLVLAFALSPDGRFLATIERERGDRRYWIRVRDLSGDQALRKWQLPERGHRLQWGLHTLVAGSRKAALIYDPDSGELMHRLPVGDGKFALSGDGRRVAVLLENHVIQVRDLATDTEVARTSHDTAVANLAFGSDNGSLITVDAVSRRVRVWRFASEEAFAALRDEAPISKMKFSKDGSVLFTASDQGVRAWQLPLPDVHSAPGWQAAPAAAAKLFGRYHIELPPASDASVEATAITVRAADTGIAPRTIALDARALAASLSRDGGRLAVILATKSTRGGYARRLEVWNVETGTRTAARGFDPVLDAGMAAYLSFAGDDRYLVVGTRAGVEIVDAEQLAKVATLYHQGVTLTAIQGDGTFAATTGSDGIVRIWETGSRNEIARIASAQGIRAIALSNDDRWLATLEDTGAVRLWALAPGDLIAQACRAVSEPCP